MRLRRSHIIQTAFMLVGLIFIVRLFCIQVLSDEYKHAASRNIIRPVVAYPYRGVIYDRHGGLLVYNAPIYDLMIIPKEAKRIDKAAFCRDFGLGLSAFDRSFEKATAYSRVKPSVFIKSLSQEAWAGMQDHIAEYSGFFVQVRTVRKYPMPILANTLGYVGEIGAHQLTEDKSYDYKQGDMIGMSGLEKKYEEVLRGERGIKYQIIDAQGITQGKFKGGALDRVPVPGAALTTTIDTALQRYGEQLMANKLGSIVAIEPKTGEILALVSSPSYDPNLLVEKDSGHHFVALAQDKLSPLFHRAIMAMYPPGSIFKLHQTLIALQERVIVKHTTHACNPALLNCHPHPSPLNLYKAIQYSCNPYFYHVFRSIINQKLSKNAYEDTRLGFERWHGYLKDLGLGIVLGIDLPGEKGGGVPDTNFYDQRYGKGCWKASTIRSLDIGQGELLITPLQMANFAAIIANRGYYYTPHLVKQIGAQSILPEAVGKHTVAIDNAHFEFVAHAMQGAVEGGTASRAQLKGIAVCAKTGTVENVHGEDHSVCIAFAPKDNPSIALAVYIENAGWGSRAAAAIVGLLVEQYIQGMVSRPDLQDYVLKGDFHH
ncbi:MAG: penicillin-binding transpeptidase domain-containing protein [Bacteroidota bacterium]